MLYSLEFLMNASTIVFTLAKLNQSTKYMLKVAKEMLAKGKSSKFNFTYKVTPFLVFVVISFFQPVGNIHVPNAAGVYLLKVNYEYSRRNCGICSKLTAKTLERSELTPLRYLLLLLAKFLRTPILKSIYQRLLLQTAKIFTVLRKAKLK